MAGVNIKFLGAAAGVKFVGRARTGLRHLAFPAGGPVDGTAQAAANQLVGNSPDSPTLELPLSGGEWELKGNGSFAITGARMQWTLNGECIRSYATQPVNGKVVLKGGFAQNGVYAYLAIGGTRISTHSANSSVSDYTEAEIVRKGWRSKWAEPTDFEPSSFAPPDGEQFELLTPLRAVPGPEFSKLPTELREAILNRNHQIDRQSNRQGVRLVTEGFSGARAHWAADMISSPVLPGTVQLTPSGLIVLGPDAQTIGGYPRVLILDGKELTRCFQSRLGSEVAFKVLGQ